MIPAILTRQYEAVQELNTARQLLTGLQTSRITGQETQFLTEKIQAIEKELSSTEAQAQELIDQLDDTQARLFAALHYKAGYQWSEIAGIFSLQEDAAKACVYRALRRVCGDATR